MVFLLLREKLIWSVTSLQCEKWFVGSCRDGPSLQYNALADTGRNWCIPPHPHHWYPKKTRPRQKVSKVYFFILNRCVKDRFLSPQIVLFVCRTVIPLTIADHWVAPLPPSIETPGCATAMSMHGRLYLNQFLTVTLKFRWKAIIICHVSSVTRIPWLRQREAVLKFFRSLL